MDRFHLGLIFLNPPQQLFILPVRSHLGVHQRGERQIIKQVREVLPHVGIAVFPQALVVEAVYLCDLPALVVASEDCDALPVAYLKTGPAQAFARLARTRQGRGASGGASLTLSATSKVTVSTE